MEYKISVLIPARNEMWLKNTVEDILKHKEAETEIIVGLDGEWSSPPLDQHPDVTVIYIPESIGQRAMTKMCAKLSRAKFIVKCDAHCSFDQGWDRKMLEAFEKTGDNVVLLPVMKNLHCFDWKCFHCGWKKYQGPTPLECGSCKKTDKIRRKVIWKPRIGINSTSYSFDSEPHFQYFEDYKHREPYLTDKKTGITETFSIQGSFFMLTREKYFELDIDDENLGSWGGQGITVACKMWLSGGRVLVNHNTWYSHMFRTQGGDFGFPYPQSGKHVSRTKQRVKDLIWSGKINGQIHPLVWLLDKFAPIPGWSQDEIEKVRAIPFKTREKEQNVI